MLEERAVPEILRQHMVNLTQDQWCPTYVRTIFGICTVMKRDLCSSKRALITSNILSSSFASRAGVRWGSLPS
jgi:hypothetical protein